MRAKCYLLMVTALLLLGPAPGIGQYPRPGEKPLPQLPNRPKPLDEEKELLNQIKEAHKAPFEVPQDILKELRKAYQQPSPEREAKIFKEIRRLYLPTPEQEVAILRAIRRAYQQPSAEQEERLFQEIGTAKRLPEGTVPPSVQVEQAGKLFRKLDLNGDGLLNYDEMSDAVRSERGRWDTNRDGFIDRNEYWAYYQGRLRSLAEAVTQEPRPVVYHAGKLPPGLPNWFVKLDTDGDGQVGLYEWKLSGRPFQEFEGVDRNGDGFLTAEELLRYLRAGGSPVDPKTGKGAAQN